MSYLDDYINNPLKLRKKRKIKTTASKKIIKIIRTGLYDPSDMMHVRMKNIAVRQGYIDEQLNILKEVK